MKKILIYTLLLLSPFFTLPTAAESLGQWKAYMAYHDITAIEPAGKYIYVLASDNLFSYNYNDSSIDTYDKMNSLSDCGIVNIMWNDTAKRLIILYDNYNIDLLDNNGEVENIPDYYNKSMTQQKTVNDIYMYNEYAYLSTAFGIIKINMKAAEVSDTYQIGVNVNYCYIKDGSIYAVSTDGVYSASLKANLLDPNTWQKTDVTPEARQKQQRTNVYDDTNHCYWTVDNEGLLMAYIKDTDGTKTNLRTGINPDGPKYNHFFFMKFVDGTLYTTGGGESNQTFLKRTGTIQVLNGSDWTIYEDNLNEKTGYYYQDISCLDIDPRDKSHVFAGSSRSGVYEFRDGKYVKNWTYDNTNGALTCVLPNNHNYVIINGLTFDSEGNLWVLDSWSEKPVVQYSRSEERRVGKECISRWSPYH